MQHKGSVIVPLFPCRCRVTKSRHGCPQAAPGDAAAAVRLQLAEREQALLLARETIQVSPPRPPAPCPQCPHRDRPRVSPGAAAAVDTAAEGGFCHLLGKTPHEASACGSPRGVDNFCFQSLPSWPCRQSHTLLSPTVPDSQVFPIPVFCGQCSSPQ